MSVKLSIFDRLKKTRVYRTGTYKPLPKRLNWEQIESESLENRSVREAGNVVKGTTRRVVVVKSPDPKVFEQAFFIVREDFHGHDGNDSDDILRQAQKVADDYVRGFSEPQTVGAKEALWQPLLFASLGGGCVGLVWFLLRLAGLC